MNKKVLALIIVAVVVVGAYASYYAYATMVLMPEDLKTFKDELNSASNFNLTEIPESQINMIEDYNALSLMPQSTRDEIAENITNGTDSLKQNLTELNQNFTSNMNKAQRYDLTLRGDIANDIRLAYDQKMIDLTNQLLANVNKQATDIKNGNSTAYANDLREYNNL
ncbi:MAG: hypothetical protein LUQ24_01085, partial [Methanobacterium sp.]|nr:hypothetical protein [Methanobacterium sp.]